MGNNKPLDDLLRDVELGGNETLEGIGKFFEDFKYQLVCGPTLKRSEMDEYLYQDHKMVRLYTQDWLPTNLYIYTKSEWCQARECDCQSTDKRLELRQLNPLDMGEFFNLSVRYDQDIARNLSLYGTSREILEIRYKYHKNEEHRHFGIESYMDGTAQKREFSQQEIFALL